MESLNNNPCINVRHRGTRTGWLTKGAGYLSLCPLSLLTLGIIWAKALVVSDKKHIFAGKLKIGGYMDIFDKDFYEKRDAAMKRFMAAKERKKARVAEITQSLREEYKERTGSYPKFVNVW